MPQRIPSTITIALTSKVVNRGEKNQPAIQILGAEDGLSKVFVILELGDSCSKVYTPYGEEGLEYLRDLRDAITEAITKLHALVVKPAEPAVPAGVEAPPVEPWCDACQQNKPCSCDDMQADRAKAAREDF